MPFVVSPLHVSIRLHEDSIGTGDSLYFLSVFTKLQQANVPVLVLVVYQRQSSISVDALKLLQRILDRLSTTLKQYIQVTEKTSKQLVRLASVQSSNMYS